MADTEDLKSSGSQGPCGFESRPRHLELIQQCTRCFIFRLKRLDQILTTFAGFRSAARATRLLPSSVAGVYFIVVAMDL